MKWPDVLGLVAALLVAGWFVFASISTTVQIANPNKPTIPEVTPQDALLAVEALEARQNAKNEAIWETIRLYHPDNDKWYEAWKSSDDVRQLPGVSR